VRERERERERGIEREGEREEDNYCRYSLSTIFKRYRNIK
jgi:hypothetical protein